MPKRCSYVRSCDARKLQPPSCRQIAQLAEEATDRETAFTGSAELSFGPRRKDVYVLLRCKV